MMVHHRCCLFGEQSLASLDTTSTSFEEVCTSKVRMCQHEYRLDIFQPFKLQVSTLCLKESHNTSTGGSSQAQARHDSVSECVSSLKDANSECMHFNDLLERVNTSARNCLILHAQELRDIVQELERRNCVLYDPTSGI